MTYPIYLLRDSAPSLCKCLPSLSNQSKCLGRCWSYLKSSWRVSRRYSVVASEVCLLALNTLFLICKADEKIPKKVGETTLTLLSTIGIISLHYSLDVVWKTIQDTHYAVKVSNWPIAFLGTAKVLQQVSNAAMTTASFIAAVQGVRGDVKAQMRDYHDMTVWGEVTIASGVLLTLASLIVSYRTLKKIKENSQDLEESFLANVRYCMDKDTLWHLIDKLKTVGGDDCEKLKDAHEIVKMNISTQLKVTLGGRLVLIFFGDVLQVVEKIYTPNSLVSAGINCVVSLAYTTKIVIEKGFEYSQRGSLDQKFHKEEDEETPLIN